MALAISKLNIQIGAGTDGLRRDLKGANAILAGFGTDVDRVGARVSGFGASLAATAGRLGGFLGIAGGAGGLGFAGMLAADAEKAQVSFKVLLGSAEQAGAVMGDLRGFAASTPFEFPELRDAARKLLAFKTPAEDLIPTLRSLGDIAAGVDMPIGELAEMFGKARVAGRLMGEDINQFTGRGIPIIQELARQFGVADGEVKKLVEDGKVGFDNLRAALESLTGPGGMFAGMMEEQSRTLSGVLSTLKDNVSGLFLEVGTKLLPVFKQAADVALVLTDKLRGMDAETVRQVAQWGAMAAGFTVVVTIGPKVVAAILTIVRGLRALATSGAIAQGVLGGPGGLAKVALGLAGGAAAAYGIGLAFDKVTASAMEASGEAKQVAAAVAEVGKGAAGTAIGELAGDADEAAKKLEKLQDAGKRLAESLRTPVEEFRDSMAEFYDMLEAGAIGWKTFERASDKAQGDLLEALKKQSELERDQATQGVGAVTRDTAAGFSAVQQALRQAEAQRSNEAKQQKLLEQIRDELRRSREEAARRKPIEVKQAKL